MYAPLHFENTISPPINLKSLPARCSRSRFSGKSILRTRGGGGRSDKNLSSYSYLFFNYSNTILRPTAKCRSITEGVEGEDQTCTENNAGFQSFYLRDFNDSRGIVQ